MLCNSQYYTFLLHFVTGGFARATIMNISLYVHSSMTTALIRCAPVGYIWSGYDEFYVVLMCGVWVCVVVMFISL